MGSSVHDEDEDKMSALEMAVTIWFGALFFCAATSVFVYIIIGVIRMIFNY